MVLRRFGRLLQVLFGDRSRGDPVTGNLMATQAASKKRYSESVDDVHGAAAEPGAASNTLAECSSGSR
jgi:hypothetical protein